MNALVCILQQYFFLLRPAARNLSYGDISDRVALRRRLHCRPFSWYIANVYPEQSLPDKDNMAMLPKNFVAFGNRKRRPRIAREGRVCLVCRAEYLCYAYVCCLPISPLASCLIYSYALIEYINHFAVDRMVTFFFMMLFSMKFVEDKVPVFFILHEKC